MSSKYMVADRNAKRCENCIRRSRQHLVPSTWYLGYHWMRELEANFPFKTIEEVVLSNKEKSNANSEKVLTGFAGEMRSV